MKKLLLIMGVAYSGMLCAQQTNDSNDIESFDEILISADRYGSKRKQSVHEIELISSKKLSELQGANLGDALQMTGKVFVQKSQMGGGSPVLRGFEASRVLLVIDGVRMNNATFRAGHLQDIVSVDPFALERLEVNFGSGSTLFGSDAMGGVLYMKTRDPKLLRETQNIGDASVQLGAGNHKSISARLIGMANLRFQSASNSIIGNASLEYQGQKKALLFNVTHSKFGNLRMGRNTFTLAQDSFGLQPYRVVSDYSGLSNIDSLASNDDPYTQPNTGYEQTDVLVKYRFEAQGLHTLNFQGSFAGDIPRYDRMQYWAHNVDPAYLPIEYGAWSYKPQNRMYLAYTYEANDPSQQRFRFAHQIFEVGRLSRAWNKANERLQLDRVNMSSFNYDRKDLLGNWELYSGFEYIYNHVNSIGTQRNVLTNEVTHSKSRYADSFASTQSVAAFAEIKRSWGNTTLVGGLRVTYYQLLAAFKAQNPWELPINNTTFSHFGPSYHFGFIQKINDKLLVKASINQSFRNPNVDDLTKVFESQRGLKLLIPSRDLKPEVAHTFDLNVNYRLNSNVYFEAGTYYSRVNDLMSDVFGEIAGKDSISWDGILTPVYQIQNVGEGHIYGFFANLQWRFAPEWTFKGGFTETQAKVKYNNGIWYPMDHIPPLYGQVSIKWSNPSLWAEAQYLFNGSKPLNEYSPSGEDNLKYTPGFSQGISVGNPSWGIVNIRCGVQIKDSWNIQISGENMLDLGYRVFASGISASGRNISTTLSFKF